MRLKILTSFCVLLCLLTVNTGYSQNPNKVEDRIQPHPENPYYWAYRGELVLLLGGTWQDNLFNHPRGLEVHLDLLSSVGGNYVRNVMSHRNVGNVFPYLQGENGLFDLNTFNEEYWKRFKNFLDLCLERDIIVQLEIWDPWDHFEDHQSFGGWSYHPFNPKNNINYSAEESGLPEVVDFPPQSSPTGHEFFQTVPALADNLITLTYQKAFVDQLLSISLSYPNVLYCINNESGEPVEWSDYWAVYLREKAAEAEVTIHVTEMRRQEDIKADDHLMIFDNPSLYSFLDISQNNAWSGLGQKHYDNILNVRQYIQDRPRPINNIKNYGAARHGEEESIARFCRIVFAGSASARFHRPHPLENPEAHQEATDYGLGLSPRAQAVISSMRMVSESLDLKVASPANHLLSVREENEAYLLDEQGKKFALYFPKAAGDGEVIIDLPDSQENWKVKWLKVDDAAWAKEEKLTIAAGKIKLKKPDEDHWVALVWMES